MGYQSIVEMASSQSLQARIVAAAATMGVNNPLAWVPSHIWHVVSEQTWGDAWTDAHATYNESMNPDFGVREDIITDAMIQDALTDVIAEELSG